MIYNFEDIQNDVHGALAIQYLGGKRYFITFINEFSRYTWIYIIQHKSDIKMIFQMIYNLVEIQYSAKIKKLKTDNRGEYVNKG
jgi:hypothetical protein